MLRTLPDGLYLAIKGRVTVLHHSAGWSVSPVFNTVTEAVTLAAWCSGTVLPFILKACGSTPGSCSPVTARWHGPQVAERVRAGDSPDCFFGSPALAYGNPLPENSGCHVRAYEQGVDSTTAVTSELR